MTVRIVIYRIIAHKGGQGREFKDLCTDIVTFDILSWSGLYDFMYLILEVYPILW